MTDLEMSECCCADLICDWELPCVHQTLGMSLVGHHGRHQLPDTFLKQQLSNLNLISNLKL